MPVTAPLCIEPSKSNKEWALRRLEEVTKSGLHSIKSLSVLHVVAAEQLAREWGGTRKETYAVIHQAMVAVPNASPDKLAALTKRFPKSIWLKARVLNKV